MFQECRRGEEAKAEGRKGEVVGAGREGDGNRERTKVLNSKTP